MDGARVIPFQPARSSSRRGRVGRDASIHPIDPSTQPADRAPLPVARAGWERRVAAGLRFLQRRVTGDYAVDEFGFDAELTASVTGPLLAPLFDRWFRVRVSGAEHLPARGGALLVANHAGGLWPADVAMTALAVHRHSGGRFLRPLGDELLFATPGVGTLARRSGATLACAPDAARLLGAGELVGAWPEGARGIGKPFGERYRVQSFGQGGFVAAALAAGVPVVPVSIVGSEEIHPVLADAKTLARLLKLPYFPITPTFPWLGPLGLVPLPSKWQIAFGAPMRAGRQVDAAEFTDDVRERIQTTLDRLRTQRRSVWR